MAADEREGCEWRPEKKGEGWEVEDTGVQCVGTLCRHGGLQPFNPPPLYSFELFRGLWFFSHGSSMIRGNVCGCVGNFNHNFDQRALRWSNVGILSEDVVNLQQCRPSRTSRMARIARRNYRGFFYLPIIPNYWLEYFSLTIKKECIPSSLSDHWGFFCLQRDVCTPCVLVLVLTWLFVLRFPILLLFPTHFFFY